jgi:nitrogen fixation NifU-like protein
VADLRELYQSVILDHNRAPRNYGVVPAADGTAQGRNPLCGDEVTVSVKLDGERIADVRFVGTGCAISKASASLMTTAVKGRTAVEAGMLSERFQALVTGRAAASDPPDASLGRLVALAGVSQFPIRVKCATLAWHALRAALDAAPGGSASSAPSDSASNPASDQPGGR